MEHRRENGDRQSDRRFLAVRNDLRRWEITLIMIPNAPRGQGGVHFALPGVHFRGVGCICIEWGASRQTGICIIIMSFPQLRIHRAK